MSVKERTQHKIPIMRMSHCSMMVMESIYLFQKPTKNFLLLRSKQEKALFLPSNTECDLELVTTDLEFACDILSRWCTILSSIFKIHQEMSGLWNRYFRIKHFRLWQHVKMIVNCWAK